MERALDVGVRGAHLCAQEAVADMLDDRADGGGGARGAGGDRPDVARGTVVFTGATTSRRGREGAVGFSAAKFGARGVAESMARELGPEGIHVAHVVIDGGIDTPSARERAPDRDPDTLLDPDRLADTYWHLVEQDDPSTMPFEVHVTNGPENSEFI
jgi:NAD(P)-dependent dehydrogenase (short-subunit alcohol dehydrogenase family)